MRTTIATLACSASLLAAVGSAAQAAPLHCAEDDPCWNWASMGDHQRGWVDTWGNPRVGGPCRFQRAVRHGWVFRYRQGEQHLHGDATALRAHCH